MFLHVQITNDFIATVKTNRQRLTEKIYGLENHRTPFISLKKTFRNKPKPSLPTSHYTNFVVAHKAVYIILFMKLLLSTTPSVYVTSLGKKKKKPANFAASPHL